MDASGYEGAVKSQGTLPDAFPFELRLLEVTSMQPAIQMRVPLKPAQPKVALGAITCTPTPGVLNFQMERHCGILSNISSGVVSSQGRVLLLEWLVLF